MGIMDIEYCKASNGDLIGILQIMNHEILHGTAVYDYHVKSEDFIQGWYDQKQQANSPVLVVKDGEDILAYATYDIYIPKVGYRFCVEHSIYVNDGHQGLGIGKKLMSLLIEEAKLNGIHTMIAVIDAKNEASVKFHEKFDFQKVGHLKEAGYKFDQWLDVVIMQLMI